MVRKKKILVVCPFPENEVPGQRLKYEQYFEHFRRNGFEITVSPFVTPAFYQFIYKKGGFLKKVAWTLRGYVQRTWELFRLRDYDGIYVFLYVTPFASCLYEALYRLVARKVIYDIDDLVFLGKASQANKIASLFRGPGKYIYLMKTSDHVITCTPYLDEYVRKYNTRTTDISSTINTEKYLPKVSYANDHVVVLGWSGSHSTAPYLRLLEKVLRELSTRHKFKLRVIGEPSFKMEGIAVEALPWREATEVADLAQIDVGLYPLPDEQWVYGKSGLKALQYMAMGIPTVATAIGANFRVIEDGVSGFLVKTETEWRDRLEQLIQDAELRRRLGENARKRVEKYYSIKANEPVYLEIFRRTYGASDISSK